MITRSTAYVQNKSLNFLTDPVSIVVPNESSVPIINYQNYHLISCYYPERVKLRLRCQCEENNCDAGCKCRDFKIDENFKGEIECGPHCSCDAENCGNRRMANFVSPKLEIRSVENIGFGVFAKEFIKEGADVGVYWGEVRAVSATRVDRVKLTDKPYGFGILDHFSKMEILIDSEKCGNFTRFINHSCKHNLDARIVYIGNERCRIPTPVFSAIRDIHPEEQLTIDYGDGYFPNLGIFCQCGEENCRYPPPKRRSLF